MDRIRKFWDEFIGIIKCLLLGPKPRPSAFDILEQQLEVQRLILAEIRLQSQPRLSKIKIGFIVNQQ